MLKQNAVEVESRADKAARKAGQIAHLGTLMAGEQKEIPKTFNNVRTE